MGFDFEQVISTEDELRHVLGYPHERVIRKVIGHIDVHCRTFIEHSPFLILGSVSRTGEVDLSPKDDLAGFVQVLDERTLAIPDRIGNKRADTLTNILTNPQVGLYFLVPGHKDTLRVTGTAKIVRDAWLRERMSMRDSLPDLAIVVEVQRAYFHCAKCLIRSDLWSTDRWPITSALPTLAQIMVDHGKLNSDVAEMEETIATAYREKLY